jgi:hypothetical protein
MGRMPTNDILNAHKDIATVKLNSYLDLLIDSSDPKLMAKADKLCYWLEDWIKFLEFEPSFSAKSLRRYKRGEIIKVHLGFNVGSEEGGLHYAIVVEKNNAKTSPVVTIIPLTSVKPTTDIENLRKGNVYLGNELFTQLSAKLSYINRHLNETVTKLKERIEELGDNISETEHLELSTAIDEAYSEMDLHNRAKSEILKMRKGSIALVNQITTISKIRIYDPKTDHDILSGIKLSNEKLDLIDNEITKNYTNYNG